MIFYDANGKLVSINRSKFINDELYYKKIYNLQLEYAKLYPKFVTINDINNTNDNNHTKSITYDNNLGYDSDSSN